MGPRAAPNPGLLRSPEAAPLPLSGGASSRSPQLQLGSEAPPNTVVQYTPYCPPPVARPMPITTNDGPSMLALCPGEFFHCVNVDCASEFPAAMFSAIAVCGPQPRA